MATLMNLRSRREGGQAVIELALTLPLLLLIVLGIFDFGFMFQRYEAVTNAAREGARIGVLVDYTANEARDRAVAYLNASGMPGTSSCGTTALSPGRICAVLTTPPPITLPGPPAKTVSLIQMEVEYDHQHAFVGPIVQLFGGTLGTVRLRAVVQMRKE